MTSSVLANGRAIVPKRKPGASHDPLGLLSRTPTQTFEDPPSRVHKILLITDQYSKIFGYRVLNSQLSLYFGVVQLVVCLWALTQHIYSIVVYQKILFCDFENTTITNESQFLVGVDAIIFDVGLFHSLWGIHGCVAQHLDGGYGRFAWCICHTMVLLFCLPLAFVSRPRPYFMWPLLIQQSAYGIGLLILSLAALPRILPTFMGDLNNAPILSILFYLLGALMNYSLLYVYYHWYWHVESQYESATKLHHNRLSCEVEADPRRKPFRPHQPMSTGNGYGPPNPNVPQWTPSTATVQILTNGLSVVKQQQSSAGSSPRTHRPNGNCGASMATSYYQMPPSPASQRSSQRPSIASNQSASKLFPKMTNAVASHGSIAESPNGSLASTTLIASLCSNNNNNNNNNGTTKGSPMNGFVRKESPILKQAGLPFDAHAHHHHYGPPMLKAQRSITNSPQSGGQLSPRVVSNGHPQLPPPPQIDSYVTPFSAMAQARYAKFVATNCTGISAAAGMRKASAASYMGPTRMAPPYSSDPRIVRTCSNSPSASRRATPVMGHLHSTAI